LPDKKLVTAIHQLKEVWIILAGVADDQAAASELAQTVPLDQNSGRDMTIRLIGVVDHRNHHSAFDIVVRRSFSDYLIRRLNFAAREFGSRILAP